MTADILDFKRRVKAAVPSGTSYVLVCVDTDGGDGFIEHPEELNGYEVLGILEWAKSLKLAECKEQQ